MYYFTMYIESKLVTKCWHLNKTNTLQIQHNEMRKKSKWQIKI